MISDHSTHIIRRFFEPSVFSWFVGMLFGMLLSALSLYFFVIKQSEFSEYYEQLFTIPANTSEQLVLINNAINTNSIVADSAIFMFWAIVGMLLYITGEMAYRLYKGGKDFLIEMEQTLPTNRLSLFGVGLQHILLRLVGVTGVFALYQFLFMLLPHAILRIYQLSSANEIWTMLVLVAAAFVTGLVVVHWLVLCLRLLVYKLRLFGRIDE